MVRELIEKIEAELARTQRGSKLLQIATFPQSTGAIEAVVLVERAVKRMCMTGG
jgi:hypothetical protein